MLSFLIRLFIRYAVAPPQRGRHQNARRLVGSRFNERGKLLYGGLDLSAAPDVHRRKSRLGKLTELIEIHADERDILGHAHACPSQYLCKRHRKQVVSAEKHLRQAFILLQMPQDAVFRLLAVNARKQVKPFVSLLHGETGAIAGLPKTEIPLGKGRTEQRTSGSA